MNFPRPGWVVTSLLLAACGPSDQERLHYAERQRTHCLMFLCDGDVVPIHNNMTEEALKLNGQWFIGPKEYFSTGINGASFEWWDHKPRSSSMKRAPEAQALAVAGKSDFGITINLRGDHIPPEPHGYALIELAQKNGWIASRTQLRPGLDAIQMKHVIGPNGYSIDHVTYYVATQLKGLDGLPPVATCAHSRPDYGGGTGFMWRPDIWAGTSMNQKHCVDWPEIYIETIRILQLLKKA